MWCLKQISSSLVAHTSSLTLLATRKRRFRSDGTPESGRITPFLILQAHISQECPCIQNFPQSHQPNDFAAHRSPFAGENFYNKMMLKIPGGPDDSNRDLTEEQLYLDRNANLEWADENESNFCFGEFEDAINWISDSLVTEPNEKSTDAFLSLFMTHMAVKLDKIKIRSPARYYALCSEIEKIIKDAKEELNIVADY